MPTAESSSGPSLRLPRRGRRCGMEGVRPRMRVGSAIRQARPHSRRLDGWMGWRHGMEAWDGGVGWRRGLEACITRWRGSRPHPRRQLGHTACPPALQPTSAPLPRFPAHNPPSCHRREARRLRNRCQKQSVASSLSFPRPPAAARPLGGLKPNPLIRGVYFFFFRNTSSLRGSGIGTPSRYCCLPFDGPILPPSPAPSAALTLSRRPNAHCNTLPAPQILIAPQPSSAGKKKIKIKKISQGHASTAAEELPRPDNYSPRLP